MIADFLDSERGAELLKEERKSRILSILRDRVSARTIDIAAELGTSRETVRRDLLTLHAEGRLEKIHGGATVDLQSTEKPFQVRMGRNWAEKLEIGRRAVDLLPPGSAVFLDAGSTTAAFAEVLRDRATNIKVFTNLQPAAQILGRKAFFLGGTYNDDVPATFGELTLANIGQFNADFAIVSPTAIHQTQGLMYYELHECEIARAMIKNARKTLVLADANKLDATSRVRLAEIDCIDILVTNSEAEPKLLDMFRERISEVY